MGAIVLVHDVTDDLIGLARDTLGLRDRRILRQTNVHIGNVKVVSRKELAVKLRYQKCSHRQTQGRGRKDLPTMVDGEGDRVLVGLAEPRITWPISASLSLRLQ